jgi:hypothetical protein
MARGGACSFLLEASCESREYLGPGWSEVVPSCTTVVHDTHKTVFREVQYRWHPWHGQRVLVQSEARRSSGAVLRCVREDLNSSPALEIPAWMFDSSICSQMKHHSAGYVSSAALLVLKDLLSAALVPIESTGLEAQHLSSSSGDADAYPVAVQSWDQK